MADAWENLLVHSFLNSGDAWEHLLAQGGGSGPADRYVAENGLVFTCTPHSLPFSKKPGGLLFQLTTSNFDFSVSDKKVTIKLANMSYTFHGVKVLE